MRLISPWSDVGRGFTVPGDSEDQIMLRSGDCVGISDKLAVWRFGFAPGSDSAKAHGVEVSDWSRCSDTNDPNGSGGFVWVLCTRKTAKVKEVFRGYALNLPENFRNVIEWEPK